jgi:enoyl-CoA hydratase
VLLAAAVPPGKILGPMTEAQRVLAERRGDIVLAVLNAPERRNAIDQQMVDALHRLLDQYWHDESIAALVLTGAGDQAFAAGADIAQLRERTGCDALKAINASIFNRIEEFPAPVIAAVKGYALGGGCELAIACDLRVLGTSAKLGQPEVKLGIIPGAGGTYRLPRLIGLGRARELCYTGRVVLADEALRIGLANEVVPDAQVVERALALGGEIAQNGRLAVRGAKRALNALARPGHSGAIAFESAVQSMLFDSDDKRARMDAFLAKQKKRDQ